MKRFPSLESLDGLNYRLLMWGFPLMTLGILTGSLWAAFIGATIGRGIRGKFLPDLPGCYMERCCTGASPRV